MNNALLAIKNSFDFFIRNHFRFSRAVTWPHQIPERDRKIQIEFQEFLELFPWEDILMNFTKSPLVVTDIGARNFVFGPVLDRLLEKMGREAFIHGIEIDSHRMLWGFHSRKDYGDYYASKMRLGFFHALDFLKWNRPTDIALLLNPFVSADPLLSWGLPLSTLKPQEIFHHAMKTLKDQKGMMILSCPSPEELEISKELAKKAGFVAGLQVKWSPKENSVQQKPRYGIVYYSELCS
ncbi:hypothetical protein EBQ74_01320 [bacterium]|nr:hypothetical protein [bacterium]